MKKPASKELYEMCLQHFNEPMLLNNKVVRLIGYAEDDIDCYIIYRKSCGTIQWISCVGGYIFLDKLKGQNICLAHNGEIWDDMYRLNSSLECEKCPKNDHFILDIK